MPCLMTVWRRVHKRALPLALLLIVGTSPHAAEPSLEQPVSASGGKTLGVTDLLESGNLAAAARMAQLSAEDGDTNGQYHLALFYWHGVALPQNFQESLRWMTLAAIGGHPKAIAARPMIIKSVEDQNVKKVMDWVRQRLQKAGEEGDNRALTLMSVSYAPEFGFQDNQEGYFWASLAVAAGQADARRRRDALVASLKPAEIAKAQDKTAEWFLKWRKDVTK
jgi:TPR repeat protein